MKNYPLLDQTITRSVQVLDAMPLEAIEQLPLQESVLLLKALSDMTGLDKLHSTLIARARNQLQSDWIRDGDLFEVFLTFNALWRHDPSYITGDCLAAAVQRLIRCEAKVGGPYCSGDTIEVAANLQISSFVRRVAKPLPEIEAFLSDAIATGRFAETIETKPYLLYLLPGSPNAIQALRSCDEKYSQAIIYRAAALATIHDPLELEKAIDSICREQQSNGFWNKDPLFSSDILASALVCGLLARHRQRLVTSSPSQLSLQHQEVAKTAKRLLDTNAEPLRTSTLSAIDAVCMVDKGYEITLLPYFFARSLRTTVCLSDWQCHLLGAANLYGWVAYGIYDDFIDDEGVPARLPVANCAMRYSLDCFQAAMPTHRHYQRYVSKVFTKMDAANAWEIANCRFTVRDNTIFTTQLPQYRQCAVLAARSFAHALGPIAVLVQHSGQKHIDRIESAFRHYLIARQLADDLYDWADDTKAGRVSYVVAAILRDMQLPPGAHSLNTLLAAMRKTFRQTTMNRVCALALYHTNKARQQFTQNGLIQATDDIFTLLDALERILERSADEYAKANVFIKR
jgi:hypothetical protein